MTIKQLIRKLLQENPHIIEEKSYPDLVRAVRREMPEALEDTIKRTARDFRVNGDYKASHQRSVLPSWIKVKGL